MTITDKVPTGTEFVSADNDGALNKESGIVTWTLNKVQPGDTGEVTMTVKVVSGAEATVENTASVQIGQDGPTVSTNTESTKIDESERTVTITPRTSLCTPAAMGTRVWLATNLEQPGGRR